MRTLGIFLVATAAGVISGCSGQGDSVSTTNIGQVRATLRKATSCADLEQSLKADALQKMNKAIDSQIRSIKKYGAGGGIGFASPQEATAGAAPKASNDADTGGSRASSYSETNKQVAGVDEADIVKTDGKYIYLLHGQKLSILNAWPADKLSEAASLAVEGEPTEMFQWEGKIVVYSRVDGTPIYQAAQLKPRANYQDYAVNYGGFARGAVDVASPYPYGGWMQNPLTKVTVIDIQGSSPAVSREVYFEGSYLSSRRITSQVRTVLQGAAPGPQLKMYPDNPPALQNYTSTPASGSAQETQLKQEWISAYESLRTQNANTINASKVSDWVPYTFTKTGAGVAASALACEDFYLPTPGTTQYGLTYLETFDASDASSKLKAAAIVGQADTVYANEKNLVLAARAWVEPELLEPLYQSTFGGSSSSGTGSSGGTATPPSTSVGTQNIKIQTKPTPTGGGVWAITTDYTHLHKFDIGADPTTALYVASGTVPGTIVNQFSIDERNGTVRVSTTERREYVVPQGATRPADLPRTANHVFTLQEKSGDLATVGSVGDLAPNESIMSTRFVGDTAYVVTFLQKDPLFVIDLKNPTAPSVLGQLTIPGFSSYMHPLDDTHLLTIGQDGGLALQIFDVSNPAAPTQAHKFVYSNEGGYSEAQNNHKAFTYFADRKLLAFPFVGYTQTGMKSTLELFKIDTTAGIQRVGGIDHTSFFTSINSVNRGYCGGYFEPAVRRGVFLENVVYSVSYGGVLANDATTLAQISSFALPQPQLQGYAGCGVDGSPPLRE